MCFINEDYDWIARQVDEQDGTATKETRCDECRWMIPVGAFVHHIHLQEHEDGDCKTCYEGDCECPEDRCCACEKPNYGETFDCDRCEGCDKFLRAVEASEIEEGCRIFEARPRLCQMIEDIRNGDHDNHLNAKRYVQKAIKLFPELKASGYLARLWRRLG